MLTMFFAYVDHLVPRGALLVSLYIPTNEKLPFVMSIPDILLITSKTTNSTPYASTNATHDEFEA
jgi:hypothetical protein